jgi:thiol:disulfide interchange protein
MMSPYRSRPLARFRYRYRCRPGFMVLLTALVAAVASLLVPAAPLAAAEREIYPAPEQAQADLDAALRTAARTHKRVIVDFGGNWCPDCQALDIYFHDADNAPLLDAHYVLVHVNIGQKDANLDIAARYHIPIDKGVPALAVLSSHGKLLYSQRTGEFEAMRHMQSSSVTSFLNQWIPRRG